MNRETARVAVLAACCIVAIALASATLPTPTQVDSSGDGDSPGGGEEFGLSDKQSGDGLFPSPDRRANSGSPGPAFAFCQPALLTVDVLGALVVGLLVSGALVARIYDRQLGAVVVVAGLVVIGLLGLLFLVACDPSGEIMPQNPAGTPSLGGEDSGQSGSGSGDGETVVPSVTLPTLAIAVLVGLGLIGLLIAGLTVGRSGDGKDEPTITTTPSAPDVTISTIAGETADEIEEDDDVALENAIYRAWADMTEQLPVDEPETSTPAEFERAAIDAGMDPHDVAELTSLFESVRYGTAPPTQQREQRARTVFRRIEAAAPPDGDTTGTADGDGS